MNWPIHWCVNGWTDLCMEEWKRNCWFDGWMNVNEWIVKCEMGRWMNTNECMMKGLRMDVYKQMNVHGQMDWMCDNKLTYLWMDGRVIGWMDEHHFQDGLA